MVKNSELCLPLSCILSTLNMSYFWFRGITNEVEATEMCWRSHC
jgi:hypothetical protein